MDFLLYMPVWLTISLLIVLSLIISYSGFTIIHKYYDYTHLEKYHNVTSYLFNAYGLLYAVLIAFVVFINWSDFNSAQSQFYAESNRISNLFHIVQGFPEPERTDLMKSIYEYVDVINKSEIPLSFTLASILPRRCTYRVSSGTEASAPVTIRVV